MNEPEALESEFDLEDILSTIKNYRDKISFLDELRKRRVSSIKAEIIKIEERTEFLEKVVLLTLENIGKKSLDFPGVAKASVSSRKDKWVIYDTDKLIEELRSDQVIYDKVVVQKEAIVKKELDEVLDTWEATNTEIPSSVGKEEGKTSIKIKFDTALEVEEVGYENELDNSSMSMNDFDGMI